MKTFQKDTKNYMQLVRLKYSAVRNDCIFTYANNLL